MKTTTTLLVCAVCATCGGTSPSAPASTTTSVPSAPAPVPPGTTASSTFLVDLPVDPGDTANNAYGIWPFGVHGSSHALDGHPGFDVEFRPGANVHAAADGTVVNALAETGTPDRFTMRIDHAVGDRHYATDYTNLASLAPGIAPGARVARGQVLGAAGVQSQVIGTTPVRWGMTHFQVNDFTQSNGLTNPNAVSPETALSSAAVCSRPSGGRRCTRPSGASRLRRILGARCSRYRGRGH